MVQAEKLVKGQRLKIDLAHVKDRLPANLFKEIKKDPFGSLIGFKMVDGNSFGLVIQLSNGTKSWFFEEELSID